MQNNLIFKSTCEFRFYCLISIYLQLRKKQKGLIFWIGTVSDIKAVSSSVLFILPLSTFLSLPEDFYLPALVIHLLSRMLYLFLYNVVFAEA